MSHVWPFLRDTVYTLLFYGLALMGLIHCVTDAASWLTRKLKAIRRRRAIKHFADLESGESYFARCD